jgi:ADP-ribosylglycohydrolase
LGAFVGDSLGSFHEFSEDVSEELIETVMQQPGGGTFSLKKGQVTDDSELALSMAYGLVEGGGRFSGDLIAKYYGLWFKSEPFDLGKRIGGAL